MPALLGAARADEHRPVLLVGVWSGYIVAAVLLALAALAQAVGAMAWSWGFYALVVAKLATNSVAWLALTRRRFVASACAVNTLASLTLFTGAIHLTGGPPSPLLALYAIEVAVVAVLAGPAVSGVVAGAAFSLYGGLVAAALFGWVSAPSSWPEFGPPAAQVIASELAIAALILAAAAAFPGAARARLRAREATLEARADQLVEANKLKAQFTASVTHELRTPLHGILGLAEVLEADVYGPVGDRQRGALRGIRESAEALMHQIDDLLEIARAESGRLALSTSRFSVAEVLDRVASTASWMKGGKSLTIERDFPEDLPVIESDRAKLVQILVNLLSNAIKFTPEGGSVRITAGSDPNSEPAGDAGGDPGDDAKHAVWIAVEDTGVGIPKGEQGRIFEAFRQADAGDGRAGAVSKPYGGVGLGLSLVKRLAELIGAEIAVESEVGNGSRFELRLPAALSSRDAADGRREA